MTKQTINISRVYEDSAEGAGSRFLVDRIWPRGIKKEALHLDGWLKDVAPSDKLRHWFGHYAARWSEFRSRYEAELDANPSAWQPILEAARTEAPLPCCSARGMKSTTKPSCCATI